MIMNILAIVGFVLTAVGLVVAFIQTYKNKQLEDALSKINKHDEAEMWTTIGIVVKTFDSLDEARAQLNGILSQKTSQPVKLELEKVFSKLQSARRGTIDQYKHLLKEASLREKKFDMNIIKRWIISGRLENTWRISQALRLLSTELSPESPVSAEQLLEENCPLHQVNAFKHDNPSKH